MSTNDDPSSQYSFRRMVREDQPFVWEALYHALFVPPGNEPLPRTVLDDPQISRYAQDWMTRPGDLGVLVNADEVPVGAAWLRRWNADHHGYGYVEKSVPELSMALVPGHRGGGLGTRLLERLLDDARETVAAVSLSVSTDNPALRLYQRFGFEQVGEKEGGSIRMIKQLGDARDAV